MHAEPELDELVVALRGRYMSRRATLAKALVHVLGKAQALQWADTLRKDIERIKAEEEKTSAEG